MKLFNIFKKNVTNKEQDDDYENYLQLMQDINDGIVSKDLLNTDPTKRGLTSRDLELIIKYGQE